MRLPLKSGCRQAQAEVHSIAHVSSHPYPARLSQCLGLLGQATARETSRDGCRQLTRIAARDQASRVLCGCIKVLKQFLVECGIFKPTDFRGAP